MAMEDFLHLIKIRMMGSSHLLVSYSGLQESIGVQKYLIPRVQILLAIFFREWVNVESLMKRLS